MERKHLLFLVLLISHVNGYAANLIDVYQQSLYSDPVFKQSVAQSLVTRENVPISIAEILPNISANVNPTLTRYAFSGTNYIISSNGIFRNPRNMTQKSYELNLVLTQPIFNFALIAAVEVQLANAKAACATLNAALQDLMIRVADAYFTVLKDKEDLSYSRAKERAYYHQLEQIKHQYQVGLQTRTDVHTATASYEISVATTIGIKAKLAKDRENLRTISGVYYADLEPLRRDFPLVSPIPRDMNEWVAVAIAQNWSIKAAQYTADAARKNIKQQMAGHLPTVTLASVFSRRYRDNINHYQSLTDRSGPGTTITKSVGLNIEMPIFSGGATVALSRQAMYSYDYQMQVLEEVRRETAANVRQSYLDIEAGIPQIAADVRAIKAALDSLEGVTARYNAGTETIIDVLNQQEKVYEAQVMYAQTRYAFVMNILLLKQAAGTLSFEDLRAINAWLGVEESSRAGEG